MGDEFWSFNNDNVPGFNGHQTSSDTKTNFDDFNFNINSTIPENELMDFASPQALTTENYPKNNNANGSGNTNNNFINGGFSINSNITAQDLLNNDDFINSLTSSFHENPSHFNPSSLNTGTVGSHMTPSQLLQSRTGVPNDNNSISNGGYLDPNTSSFRKNSIQPINNLGNSYASPVASPYGTNNISTSISRSFQPRHNSIYEDSIASPQTTASTTNNNISDVLQSQYFSPQPSGNQYRSGSFQQSQVGSFISSRNPSLAHPIRENSIVSPIGSFNETMSPYSYNESSFKSPKSYGMSPAAGATALGTSVPKSQLTKEEKLKRRREFHNQVERRRRDLIKEKIKELGLIVPPSLLSSDSEGKDSKASKSVIINKSVEYMVHLNKVMKEQDKRREILLAKIKELESYPDVNGMLGPPPQSFSQNQTSVSSTPNNASSNQFQQQPQQHFDSFTPSDSFNSHISNFNENSTHEQTPSQAEFIQSNNANGGTVGDLGFDISEFLKEQGVSAVGINNPMGGGNSGSGSGQW